MKKHVPFFLGVALFNFCFCENTSGDIAPLNSLASKKIFEFKNEQEKQAINQKLIKKTYPISQLKFNGVTLENLDLSGMYLRGINFSGCKFVKVNFKNADLTETNFHKATFEEVDLEGTIYYYPLDKEEKPIKKEELRVKNADNHYELVKQYSDWMHIVRSKRSVVPYNKTEKPNNLYESVKKYSNNILSWIIQSPENEEPEILLKKAEGLNNLLGPLGLKLINEDLKGFDLTNLGLPKAILEAHLQRAWLYEAHLQRAWLSENVQIPDYPENNKTELFKLWAEGTPEQQECYQKLVNACFNLITGVDPELVRTTLEKKVQANVDLSNAFLVDAHLEKTNLINAQLKGVYLTSAYLQESNLTNAQLQNASLFRAYLQGANLTKAQLQNANLQKANLKKAWLSENVQVPYYSENNRTELFKLWANGNIEQQKCYQKLMNARFNLIQEVDPELVRTTLEKKVQAKIDLSNAYLENIHLEKTNLINAQLKGSYLQGTHLQESDLTNTKLQGAELMNTNLQGANLTNTQLQRVKLFNANLQGANLTNAQLQNAKLDNANLQGAWLSENVQIPYYSENNRTELFKLWANGNTEQQKCYQKLMNARFNLIQGVDPELVRTTLEKKVQAKIDLSNADLWGAYIEGADLINAKLQGTILDKANLQRANLTNTQLQDATLEEANLQEANLTNAKLQDARLDNANLQRANLTNTNLARTRLYNVNLQEANLTNAQLQKAYLGKTNLVKAQLQGANLRGANLSKAKLSNRFILPDDCQDKDLVDIYWSCEDQEAKKLLKEILIGKEILIEN